MTSLLERDGELDALRAAVTDAAGGRGSVVLVAGEAGIGKSSLIEAWTRDPGHDARVLIGWCDDLLTSRTLGPLRDVARATGGALADAVAELDTGKVLEALLAELTNPLRPTLLVLEDVHWADEATLDVVRYVGRRIERLPAVLAVSYRDDEVSPDHPLRGVLGVLRGPVHRVAPHPLTATAIARMTAGMHLDPGEVLRITGGNPFFVTEIASGLDELPASVADAVTSRVRALPHGPREVVELLSALPDGADLELAAALGLEDDDVAVAEARGLLVLDEARTIRFRHELARLAVRAALPVAARIGHHRRVLEPILGREDEAVILHHAVEAGRTDVVCRYGPPAAHDAFEAGAYRQAIQYQEHVLPYAELLDPNDLAWLQVERAWSLYNHHRFHEAAAAAEAAVAVCEEQGDVQTMCRMLLTRSRMLYMVNRLDDAFEVLDVVEPLLAHCESFVEAEYLQNRVSLLTLSCRYEEALAEVDRARAAAEAVDRPDLVAHVENYTAGAMAMLGDIEAGIGRLRQALDLAQSAGTLEAAARAHTNLVELLEFSRHLDEAVTAADEAIAYYDDHDFRAHRFNTLSRRGRIALLRGDWDRARADLQEAETSVRGAGVLEAIPLEGMALLAVRTGAEDADDRVEQAWSAALATSVTQFIVPMACVGIEWAWSRGRPGDATPFATRALEVAGRSLWRPRLQWWLRLVGQSPDASEPATEPERTSLAGDHLAAAEAWGRLGLPVEQALELLLTGKSEPSLEALRILDSIGAEPAARMARHQLRELGVQRLPRGPQAATRQHPAGLTERQAEVLELLVEGLTNPEIAQRLVLSVRTVDHHVAAVLQKLGVGSRQEAAALGARLEGGSV